MINPNNHERSDLFRESVLFTAGLTGYSAILVEKDYFCTLLLSLLAENTGDTLIFKGGTCLTKVFFDFYRLSEDLDFIIPMPVEAKKKERSNRVESFKQAIAGVPTKYPVFRVVEGLKGANESRQYIASIGYNSLLDGRAESIKVEIGLREPLLRDSTRGIAKTILRDAATSQNSVHPIELSCLCLKEAMAEKFRAALSRREVAIRDFYDIEHAESKNDAKFEDPDFIELVRQKLAIPGNDPPNVSDERLASLRDQQESRLKSVLRGGDFDAFDLDRSIAIVKTLHCKLELGEKA